ncbi:hypothetical protein GYMLUDRAFT_50992 [Collybiopsis luxurians FD-317 M1]|uniref:Unplaced genomic scaffold GYMLUscaffold_137, whole genome shotgun sequence n=1 Tax=Collybiopsis luxurians FD-317 M1 TaxID=944289 RepID=A0A0D0BZD8_9AGAR|nr:hypothetical protein GYMLUDRAFT_50992 [Collybiopsis luxurians FD-317 M1]
MGPEIHQGVWRRSDQGHHLRFVQKIVPLVSSVEFPLSSWGESAGSISASLHMLANGGDPEGLFRAAFMESGSPLSVGDITLGQKYYNQLVAATNCSRLSNTLECLRHVPYPQLKAALDETPNIFSYQSIELPWLPRVDGVFLLDNPQMLVQRGEIAPIPVVTGNCDDEGTIFSLASLNVTSGTAFKEYIRNVIIPNISDSHSEKILELYPEDPTKGSPFDTGLLNAITPEYKRIAALLGDVLLHGPGDFSREVELESSRFGCISIND